MGMFGFVMHPFSQGIFKLERALC